MLLTLLACLTELSDPRPVGDSLSPDDSALEPQPCDGFLDDDGDGFGLEAVTFDCPQPPEQLVLVDGDCDDANSAIHPNAAEICNGVDDDCDERVDDEDDDVVGAPTWFQDQDEDGYGLQEQVACAQPPGHEAQGGDCDDADKGVNPSVTEVCNGRDDDCDGEADSDDVCPCPVVRYEDHVYLFCEQVKSWGDARSACGQGTDGFDLVVFEDQAENDFVASETYARDRHRWWWIGLRQIDKWNEPAGSWQWVDGTDLSAENWGGGQPDNDDYSEDCVHLYPDSGLWNDLQCWMGVWYGQELYFVCESS